MSESTAHGPRTWPAQRRQKAILSKEAVRRGPKTDCMLVFHMLVDTVSQKYRRMLRIICASSALEIAGPRLLHIHSYSFRIHAVCLRPAVAPQSPNLSVVYFSIFSKFAQV